MTLQEFKNALTSGNNQVIYTDVDGTEYTHTIIKAGPKQVNLMNHFLNKEYKLGTAHHDYTRYRLNH